MEIWRQIWLEWRLRRLRRLIQACPVYADVPVQVQRYNNALEVYGQGLLVSVFEVDPADNTVLVLQSLAQVQLYTDLEVLPGLLVEVLDTITDLVHRSGGVRVWVAGGVAYVFWQLRLPLRVLWSQSAFNTFLLELSSRVHSWVQPAVRQRIEAFQMMLLEEQQNQAALASEFQVGTEGGDSAQ